MPEKSAPESPTSKPPAGDSPSSGKKAAGERKPLLAAGKEAEAKSMPAPAKKAIITGAPAMAAGKTDSRGPLPLAMILLSQVLLLGVGGWWLHTEQKKALEARIASLPPPPAAAPAPPPPAPDTSALESSLQRANAQIQALQRQLDSQTEDKQRTQGRLQEMADRMALLLQQNSFTPGPADGATAEEASQVAALLPSVSPATRELILIKERNRLTDYADKAIATGRRADLQFLVETLMNPEEKQMHHAAQAEFKRVQAYYEVSTGMDPGYTLPVQELFKDAGVLREADLTPAQLQRVLGDLSLPWEARLRAAFLLRSSPEKETDLLLLKALKEDPSLDVAKQAQTTFERRVGRRFRLFDIPAIEAWWEAQGAAKPAVPKMIEVKE
jgi:hypothetical protein